MKGSVHVVCVGIIVNMTKDIKLEITSKIINWLEQRNCEVLLTEIVSQQLNKPDSGYAPLDIYKKADFVIVLGGDGTLLGAARQCLWLETPILGVNMGNLGFITEAEVKDVYTCLDNILRGDYSIESRMMLEASVIKDDKQIETFYCLNDIGLTKGTLSRIINLKTYIDDNYFDRYFADGLLISTPTGSTAYSLSAGGPIVSPNVNVILITPICPHSLNSRTLIVSESDVITVEVDDGYQEVYLTVDGQQGFKLMSGDKVVIKKLHSVPN
ncbi:NAD(+)/NADH kinase [Fervidicella metallireducens]|uniref:NAD(+)/NADH kinase n=1 Tax=Fervidicella metallireducens TaxID=655338 RepID=UPI00191C3F38|nr:NAD(+)/NADH kinase [Fervidicella metallireducens]